MSSSIPEKLIGPNRRRIVVIDPDTTKARTVENLLRLGWSIYHGPAVIDADGWVVEGTLEPSA